MVIEERNAVGLEQLAQPIGLTRALGLGDAEEQFGDAPLEACPLHGIEGRERLYQRFRRSPRLRGDDEAGRVEIEGSKRSAQRMRIEVVVKPRAWARLLRLIGGTGDAPTAKLGERLSAQAGAANPKKHQRTRA